MIPTGRQFREGRALAGMSQADLAKAANVGVGLVMRVEAVDWLPMLTRRDSTALQTALEAAGVEFIPGEQWRCRGAVAEGREGE